MTLRTPISNTNGVGALPSRQVERTASAVEVATPSVRQDALTGLLAPSAPMIRADFRSTEAAQVPAEWAEERARDVLESTLEVIDQAAGGFIQLQHQLMRSGSPAQIADLERAIASFLVSGEKAMAEVAAGIVDNELSEPPSNAMQLLLAFMASRIWTGIRTMQEQIRKAVDDPLPADAMRAMAWPHRPSAICQELESRLAHDLHQQAQGIHLGRTAHKSFNPRNLVSVAALLAQLQDASRRANSSPDVLTRAATDPKRAVDGERDDGSKFDGAQAPDRRTS